MLTQVEVITLIREGVWTVITAAGPLLLVAIGIGLLVSIFQATTSINEQTLAFVPKIVAILSALILFGPYIITRIVEYIQNLYMTMNSLLS